MIPDARLALLIAVLALTCLVPDPCAAQESTAAVDPGTHIRVLRTDSRVPQEATLVAFGRDSLVFQPGGCCVVDTVPLSSLTAVDVRRGVAISEGRVLGGMAWGLLAGLGAGLAVGEVACRAPEAGELCGLGTMKWMTILGASGLIAGALWGAESKVEKWERIYPPRRASLIVAPNMDRGFSIGVVIPLDADLLRE